MHCCQCRQSVLLIGLLEAKLAVKGWLLCSI
jgi:hypothetical protein